MASDQMRAALLERAKREKARRTEQAATQPAAAAGPSFMENIWGKGEIDTPGERLGATINDMGSELAKGIGRGATGLLTIPQSAGSLLDMGMEALTGVPMQSALPDSGAIANATASNVMPRAPETTAGEYAATVGEFIPGAALGGASAIPKFALAAGLGSEAAGQLTEGTAAEPYARMIGALAAPSLAGGLTSAARKAVSPAGGAPEAKLAAAKLLESEGIKVTAGQATGNEAQLFREAATTAGENMVNQQAGQFTKAVLKRIGSDADAATPEVLVSAARRIGGVFDDVAKGVDVPVTPDILTKSSAALQEYSQLAPRAGQAPIVAQIHKKMTSAFRTGAPLTSKQVLNWRSALSKLTRTGDAATREAAVTMVGTLDDALATTLTGMGRADDVARLSQARAQWGDLIAIENAASRAGEQAANGIITPANLRNALASQNRRAFVQGRGALNDLARAGVTVIKPLPQSGTQPRTLARELTAGAQGGTAAGLGSFAMGVDPATAAMIGGAAVLAPRARNGLLSTPPGQAYMGNQLLGPSAAQPNLPGRIGGLVSGLIAGN